MVKETNRQEGHEEDENLQDSFVSAIIIGLLILAMWLWIFFVYLDRM